MSSPRAKIRWRRSRWLAGAALLGLMPKCVLCVVAYATAGTLVGGAGRELCDPTAGTTSTHGNLLLVLPVIAASVAGLFWLRPRRVTKPS